MNVRDAEYYHIHRGGHHSDLWQVGGTIYLHQKELNPFNRYYDTWSRGTRVAGVDHRPPLKQGINLFLQQPKEYQLAHYEELLRDARDVIQDQSIYIRETVFEEVRTKYFPHLPSRKMCIWVMAKGAVSYWWQTLGGDNRVIYRVALTGVIHRADQRYLNADSWSQNQMRAWAFEYWTGADGENPVEEELLFEGSIKVLEKYADLSEFMARISAEPQQEPLESEPAPASS